MKYWPTGTAWEDVADFAKDENIWLKTFAKAWHMGTENGQDGLSYLDAVIGQERETLTSDEAFDCTPRNGIPSAWIANWYDQCE